MSFSELLKQCRKQKGISQAELASKLGVTQQAVGKWESGKSSPDPATVARIAEILSTTADFLLGLYRPVSNVTTPEERFFGNYAESLIPVIGTVKAGYGALAFEEDYGQEYARVKDPPITSTSSCAATAWSPASRTATSPLSTSRTRWKTATWACWSTATRAKAPSSGISSGATASFCSPSTPLTTSLVIKGEDLNRLHIAGRVVETKAKW